MSFTTGTLLSHESIVIADLYHQLGDWDAVRTQVIGDNRLQMRTLNASKRIYREISSRLRLLTPPQLELLGDSSLQEQNYLLWLAICRRYRFIYDFAVEVVREKFLRLDRTLTYEDYDAFFHQKAEWHPEVERVAAATRAKQRQVVFKMLREADLLSKDDYLLPAMLTPRLIATIVQDNAAHLAVFPVGDADIREWTEAYADR